MTESFLNDRVKLHLGDCLDVLDGIEECSVDSCVTDPPYHLTSIVKRFGGDNAAPAKYGTDGAYARASKGFMSKTWDGGDIAFRPELWAKVYRVLKPGAHLLAFGGDRTQHRVACAIEDAGFEVRGTILWLFATGFPKNLNVSAKMRASFPAHALCACVPHCQQTVADSQSDYQLVSHCDGEQPLSDRGCDQDAVPSSSDARERTHDGLHADGRDVKRASTATDADNGRHASDCSQVHSSRQLEDFQAHDNTQSDISLSRLPDELTAAHRMGQRKLGTEHLDDGLGAFSFENVNLPRCSVCGKFIVIDGFGTALKPAAEFICLARKPISESTVAANVLKWGTGAINVGSCRVPSPDADLTAVQNCKTVQSGDMVTLKVPGHSQSTYNAAGRWPANVIHDGSDEVVEAFPESGPAKSGGQGGWQKDGYVGGKCVVPIERTGYDDNGGSAARFFYTAKADSDDRLGSKHPTVKPLDLMQYLVRLITPRRGLVLDLFAGTGTTGEAAWREGMSAVLIELEAEYQDDIRRRMKLALAGPDERTYASIKARMNGKPPDHGPLFDHYNAEDDFGKSINECYREVRERKAAGGPGWPREEA